MKRECFCIGCMGQSDLHALMKTFNSVCTQGPFQPTRSWCYEVPEESDPVPVVKGVLHYGVSISFISLNHSEGNLLGPLHYDVFIPFFLFLIHNLIFFVPHHLNVITSKIP